MSLILAIETSCDETAAAVIEDGHRIRSNVVASQIELHRPYGGVFPEIASRQHVYDIVPVIEAALADSGAGWDDLTALAVTRGPGLAGSLLVGVNTAKAIAWGRGLPIIGVNHLEGHLYSNWLDEGGKIVAAAITRPSPAELDAAGRAFPLLVLIVSGGHTEIILMQGHGRYRLLGATLDDAAGEAFDKVARLLGLSYPGGPAVQKAAEDGNPAAFDFPRALTNYAIQAEHRFNFSFSGLKTAVLRQVRELGTDPTDSPHRRPGGQLPGRGGGCAGDEDRRCRADPRRGAHLRLRRGGGQQGAAAGRGRAAARARVDPAVLPLHRQRGHDRRGRALSAAQRRPERVGLRRGAESGAANRALRPTVEPDGSQRSVPPLPASISARSPS